MKTIEEDFSSPEELSQFQKNMNKQFSGIAKLWHIPFDDYYHEGKFAFTVISFLPKHQEKINNILQTIKNKNDIYLNIYSEKDTLLSISPHGHDSPMVNRILTYINYKKWKEKSPDHMFYILFYGDSEKENDNNLSNNYYHVSLSPTLEKTGITPQSNVKFKNRIYFWDNIEHANYFAKLLKDREKNSYIYKIVPIGKIFKDKEPNPTPNLYYQPSDHAFYSNEKIPSENVKMITTFEENFYSLKPLLKSQKKVNQLGPTEKAKNIKVIGKKEQQHPFQGKLVVTSESVDPLITLKKLSGILKE